MSLRYILLIPIVLLASSCGTKSINPSIEGSMPPENLLGDWILGCSLNNTRNPNRRYMTSMDKITEGFIVSEAKFFLDPNCREPGSPKVRKLVVKVSFPEGATKTAHGRARHMNATIQRIEYDGIALTGNTKDSIYEQVGKKIHDIYQIRDGVLLFGQYSREKNGATKAKRFGELATGFQFSKVGSNNM